jgi:hypothetical protein
MDEQEFDSWTGLRPFKSQHVKQFERVMALASALWGPGISHIQRQLIASHPEIPAGFDLVDFRNLQRQSEVLLLALQRKPPGQQWGSLRLMMDAEILVGNKGSRCWKSVAR